MHVELCNFGARILSIKVPDKDGKLLETTLNQANDEDIISDKFYMGASIGRTCNRISNSQFSLDGVEFSISTNDGVNNLHGGEVGFSKMEIKGIPAQ
jgi:aldose 1-epimerase